MDLKDIQQRIADVQERRNDAVKSFVDMNVHDFSDETRDRLRNKGLMTSELEQLFRDGKKFMPPKGVMVLFFKHTYDDSEKLRELMEQAKPLLYSICGKKLKFPELDREEAAARAALKELAARAEAVRQRATSLPPARKTSSTYTPPPKPAPTPIPRPAPRPAPAPRHSSTGGSHIRTSTHRYYDTNTSMYYDDDFYYQNQNNALFSFLILQSEIDAMNNPGTTYYTTDTPLPPQYVDTSGNPVDPSLVDSGQYAPVDNTPQYAEPAASAASDNMSTYNDQSNYGADTFS